MDLYTLPPVYSTPSMMTPAYSEHSAIPPILSLYYSYTHSPISSLSLSMDTATNPLREMATHGDSIYSPSTVRCSLRTMLSLSTGTHDTGISLYGRKEGNTLSPLYTVTLPLRDIAYFAIHSPLTAIPTTVLSKLSDSCDTGYIDMYEIVVLIDAECALPSTNVSFSVFCEAHDITLEVAYALSFYNDMSLMNKDKKTFTEAFLFHSKTILSRDESVIKRFVKKFLTVERVLIEGDFFSDMQQLMNNLTSDLRGGRTVIVSDSFLNEGVTTSNEEAGKEFAASDFDTETLLSGDSSADFAEALWENFFHSLLSDGTANHIDDNYLVAPTMELSTTDWSM
jgi:hypothetical protein